MRLAILLLVILSGCSFFLSGKDEPKSAKGSLYTIKFSDSNWEYQQDNRSDYVYENKKNGHIILSNSFCDEFQDQPLKNLAEKTFSNLTNFEPSVSEYTTFQNREAYRMEGDGLVDGVKVGLRLLNTRRDHCYFDFVSILPRRSLQGQKDVFDEFLKTVVFK